MLHFPGVFQQLKLSIRERIFLLSLFLGFCLQPSVSFAFALSGLELIFVVLGELGLGLLLDFVGKGRGGGQGVEDFVEVAGRSGVDFPGLAGFGFAWCLHATTILAIYDVVNFVTAFVPSATACFASSPGSISLTAV